MKFYRALIKDIFLLVACLSAVVVAPRWCSAPCPVLSLLVLQSAFLCRRGAFPHPVGCRPQLYWAAAQGTRRPARNRALCPCPAPLPRQGRWARWASYPFTAPRWGCPWRVPPASVLGCVRCGGSACVDLVTDTSGFLYRPPFDGGLGRCTWAVSCGRRHLPCRVACVHLRALLGRVRRTGLPGAFWCASPFLWPSDASSALAACLFFSLFLVAPFLPLPSRVTVVSGVLCFPAPGALGLGAPPFFFRPCVLFLCVVCPLAPCAPPLAACSRPSVPAALALYGSPPDPPRPLSFFVFFRLFSLLLSLFLFSPLLRLPPSLARFCVAVFVFFFPSLAPPCLGCWFVSGPRCPGPRCFVAASPSALSPSLCFFFFTPCDMCAVCSPPPPGGAPPRVFAVSCVVLCVATVCCGLVCVVRGAVRCFSVLPGADVVLCDVLLCCVVGFVAGGLPWALLPSVLLVSCGALLCRAVLCGALSCVVPSRVVVWCVALCIVLVRCVALSSGPLRCVGISCPPPPLLLPPVAVAWSPVVACCCVLF